MIFTDEQQQKFLKFQNLLTKWTNTYNLVQKNSLKAFWERHILDSCELYPHLALWQQTNPNDSIADLGSGAGLPGIVLSILGIKNLVLIESQQKKSKFLLYVKRSLNLNYEVFEGRIENCAMPFSSMVARALAKALDIIAMASFMPCYDSCKTLWLLKGEKSLKRSRTLAIPSKLFKDPFQKKHIF